MSEEAGFLDLIQRDRHNDQYRLIYADWLEDRGDPRAEYLRLQVKLKQTWWYDNPRQDIFARLDQLRPQIDPLWLQQTRRCTTPAPPADITELLPELEPFARTTIRLHPRRGVTAADQSKLGGVFLWPPGEKWPRCEEHREPFAPVLQLQREDVPEMEFPEDSDLFQLLWCPVYQPQGLDWHELPIWPHISNMRVYWRNRAESSDAHDGELDPDGRDRAVHPQACTLYPERTIEYPPPSGWPVDDLTQWRSETSVRRWMQPLLSLLETQLFAAGASRYQEGNLFESIYMEACGTKVGGYPGWQRAVHSFSEYLKEPEDCHCDCGRRMEYLLTLDSGEWNQDGRCYRWSPVEDRDLTYLYFRQVAPPGVSCPADREQRLAESASAPGWWLGLGGKVNLFICRHCAGWPCQTRLEIL